MMVKLIFFTLMISLKVFANANLNLYFKTKEVNFGEIVEAEFALEGISKDQLRARILNNNLSDSFHVIDVGEDSIKGFFYNTPTTSEKIKIEDLEIGVNFLNVKVNPIQEEKNLIFENFEVKKNNEISWAVFLTVILFTFIVFYFLYRFYLLRKEKKFQKEKLIKLKEELLTTKKYEDIVKVWEKRKIYFDFFPHIESEFQRFEVILNQHQFKPVLAETEKIEIIEGYRKFTKIIEGGFRGI